MRLDLVAVSIVFATALAVLAYAYSTAVSSMENWNLHAWLYAEQAAEEFLETGSITLPGKYRVTSLETDKTREYGACRLALGYAYTFRIINNSLVKVEAWYCGRY